MLYQFLKENDVNVLPEGLALLPVRLIDIASQTLRFPQRMKISCVLSVWFSKAGPGQSYQPCNQKQSDISHYNQLFFQPIIKCNFDSQDPNPL